VPSFLPSESPYPSGLPSFSPTLSQKPSAQPSLCPSTMPSDSPSVREDWCTGYNIKTTSGTIVTTTSVNDTVLNLGSLPSDMTLCAEIVDYTGVDRVLYYTNFGNPGSGPTYVKTEYFWDYCLGTNYRQNGNMVYFYAPELYVATSSLIIKTVVYYTDTSKPPTTYQIKFIIIDDRPTNTPTRRPTKVPTSKPTSTPTSKPTSTPTSKPTSKPSAHPSAEPSDQPSSAPSSAPSRCICSIESAAATGQCIQFPINTT